MAEFESALNKILSSPEDMKKILDIASSLGEQQDDGDARGTAAEANPLGGISPEMLGMMTKLIGVFGERDDDKARLIHALQPYIKSEQRERLARALQISKMARAAKIAAKEFNWGAGK
ncbi:MAG: hypothetical protein LBC78_01870 [Oscillospiraceae bacterium]|jgi:hypothetical protein|nr:hypothetical protein [Oscillospiraceae bacterium]